MPGPSFRDRFFASRKVARAVTSPWSIMLAGGVAAVGILAGIPIVAALPIGAAAYAGRVLMAVPRSTEERIDPFTVNEPWRRFVQDALLARHRFDDVVRRMQPGPLQDSLSAIADRVHAAVEESYRIAQRGQALDRARRDIDVPAIDRGYAELGASDPNDPVTVQVREALDAQRATAQRLDRVMSEAQSRLRLLDARMDEALARAIELSAQSESSAAVGTAGTLGTDVDNLVTEMEALRQALDETSGTPGGLSAPGGPP
ncbi:MAG TPA: hypothetical protein VKA65_00675 [Acidimicrobiales bacterium]|nr:hypothetical protein [Acidimicrobiales bacterium]